jgi:hypothetical protein
VAPAARDAWPARRPRFSRSLAYWAILWDVHLHTALLQPEVRKPGFQQRLEQELAWVQATKHAVVKARETYLGILEGDNSGVKIAAAYLLGLIGASDFDTSRRNHQIS